MARTIHNEIRGKDGFVEIFITEAWFNVFCFKSCDLNFDDEEIEKTGPNSGRSREFTTGFGSGTCRVSGISTLDNTDGNVSPLWFLQHRTDVHRLRLNLTDVAGNQQQIAFDAIMRRTSLSNDISQWAQCSIEFRITGDIDAGDIISPPTPEQLFSDFWDTTPAATSVTGLSTIHGYSLAGITPLSIYREGTEHDIISAGSPTNRQCKYVSATPAVLFPTAIPFNSGERVFIVFTK